MQTQDQPEPLINETERTEVTVESPEAPTQTAKPKNWISFIFLRLLLVFIAVNLGMEFLKFLGNAVSCGASKSVLAEAKVYVGSMNRAQQAFQIENNQFANAVEPLGLGMRTQTASFNYSTRTTGNAAFSYAIPREDAYEKASWGVFSWKRSINYRLKPYVGGVFVIPQNGEGEMATVLCESLETGTIKIAEPYLENNIPTCGKGTRKL